MKRTKRPLVSDGTLHSRPSTPQTPLSPGLESWAECPLETGFEGAGQSGGLAAISTFEGLQSLQSYDKSSHLALYKDRLVA